MKILGIRSLPLPEIKVIRMGRNIDNRGYFLEPFRKSDLFGHPELADSFRGVEFVQTNESLSRPGTMRGLHFQWDPAMGKLVRTLRGRMIDVVLDIRKGSPTYGKAIAHDMPNDPSADFSEWIWVPPGFAHGNFFPEETVIEYFCTAEHNPECEGAISFFSPGIDWSLCDLVLKALFDDFVGGGNLLLSAKDEKAPTLEQWENDTRSRNFIYTEEQNTK
jgi:dTDP-4-dehydrorhamnose 3,5-epimerase